MTAVNSTMLDLGTKAPDFTLPRAGGGSVSLSEFKDFKGLLVMFICNHCPFVKHVDGKLTQMANEYMPKGIQFVAINANDWSAYPDDSPEKMAQKNYPFPYLYDESQEVAKAYKAACTPDFFFFNKDLKLVYRGQLDDSRPSNDMPITGKDLKNAMDALLANASISDDQKPSIGCNIKWRAGNEPEYFG